ncbi:MAG: 5-guanidino-2-oxopentanoate decarboxylase [Pseudomonadales bacterium]
MSTLAQALLGALRDYGVDTVFGIPGNHTIELYRGLEQAGIRHITSRHEQGAAFMADGYARASGRPGVCLLISGPGLLNAATALAQARADSVPVLAISAVAPRRRLGMGHGTLHELPDQRAAAASFCRWSHTLLHPDNLEELLHRAFSSFACSRPGPVHIEIPLDLMTAPLPSCSARPLPAPPAPAAEALRAAAARLASAQRPLLLVGGGAIGAADLLPLLAERLDAPVLNTVNGKGVCPCGHPLAVGGSPSLPVLARALADSDCVLAIGTELGETDYDLLMQPLPNIGAGLIRMDIDPEQLTRNAPAELALVCDARAGVAALLDALHGTALHGGRAAGTARAAELERAITRERHWHPEMAAFFAALAHAAPDAVLVGDSTRPTYYAAWQYECESPRSYFHSASGFGTLGYALPAALGAKLASPRPVLALIGDGGLQFTLPELLTGAEAHLPVAVIVWCNDGYQEIANSMTASGIPVDSTRVATPDLQQTAASQHCHYERAATLGELQSALRSALGRDAPTLIEVRQSDFLASPSGGWYQ